MECPFGNIQARVMKKHLQQFWLCAHHHFLQSLFHTYLLHHQSPPMPPVQIRIQDNPRHLNIEQIKHMHGQFGMIKINSHSRTNKMAIRSINLQKNTAMNCVFSNSLTNIFSFTISIASSSSRLSASSSHSNTAFSSF